MQQEEYIQQAVNQINKQGAEKEIHTYVNKLNAHDYILNRVKELEYLFTEHSKASIIRRQEGNIEAAQILHTKAVSCMVCIEELQKIFNMLALPEKGNDNKT